MKNFKCKKDFGISCTGSGGEIKSIPNVNVDSSVKIMNVHCEILDTIPLTDLKEYNRNIYTELKDNITSEDKTF